jgi:hypothetical protein
MQQIVHVIPLGWEYDRAVLPVISLRAHRVYILCDAQEHEPRRHFLAKVVKELTRRKVDVVPVLVDSFLDIGATMREVTKILTYERAQGNRVFVNTSTSGKVAAIGVTLAAMAQLRPGEGGIYYVEAEEYPSSRKGQREHGIAKGMRGDPIFLPLFRIRLPDQICMKVLALLATSQTGRLRYQSIIEKLRRDGERGFEQRTRAPVDPRRDRTSLNVSFNQQVVRKLVRDDYVRVIEEGRSRSLSLTLGGRYLATLGPSLPED